MERTHSPLGGAFACATLRILMVNSFRTEVSVFRDRPVGEVVWQPFGTKLYSSALEPFPKRDAAHREKRERNTIATKNTQELKTFFGAFLDCIIFFVDGKRFAVEKRFTVLTLAHLGFSGRQI